MSDASEGGAESSQIEELQAELERWKTKAQAPDAGAADLQNEVKRWKRKAQEAEALLADAASLGTTPAEAKVKELARKNRDLHVQLNRARKDLVQEKNKAPENADTLTYTQQRAQAKLDAEAQIEIAKYKRLYTGGAERLGRLQQEKEKLGKDVSALQSSNKDLHGKIALLNDQLRSFRKSESPEREHNKTARSGEDRGGLIWKNRFQEQSQQLQSAQADLEKTRLAADAALSRRAALERDIKQLRVRIKAMLEKSDTDDELIAALTAERQRYTAGDAAGTQSPSTEVASLKSRIRQQQSQLDRQETIINALSEQIESLEAASGHSKASMPQENLDVDVAGAPHDEEQGELAEDAGSASDEPPAAESEAGCETSGLEAADAVAAA